MSKFSEYLKQLITVRGETVTEISRGVTLNAP